MVRNGTTYRIVSDHLGSVRAVVDVQTGATVQRLEYDDFGAVLTDTNPGFQPFGFAGGMYDHATGLVRFGARDYDGFTGRWTARDPALYGGGQANLYAYVSNDPINATDPTGLWESAFGTSLTGTSGVGSTVNYGLNWEYATNNESGIYAVGPSDVMNSAGLAASAGLSINIAFGEEGATWDGPFDNFGFGPFSVFWTPGDTGPSYYGVDVGIPGLSVGKTFGYFQNQYLPLWDATGANEVLDWWDDVKMNRWD